MSDPVQRQFEAYNAHDASSFVAHYADDVVVSDGFGVTLMNGREAMRAAYSALFAGAPDLRAEVLDRHTVGAWTVDHERVTRAGEVLEVLVAYLVEGELIVRVVMLR